VAGEVFVSYRWTGSSGDAAARLAGALQQRLGKSHVSFDIEQYRAGDLREQVPDRVKRACVLLVVIHPEWLAEIPELHKPDDWVRQEIELAREFDVKIVPVLVNRAQMPAKEQLPESIRDIVDASGLPLDHATYDAQVDRLAAIIRPTLPGKVFRALERFADSNAANAAFAIAILGALLLFTSRMLDIHTIRFTTRIATQWGDTEGATEIVKEGGVLMAWNWSVALLLITPAMVFLFNNTLREAKKLLDGMQLREMIFYVGANYEATPLSSRGLWSAVTRPTAVWCQVFVLMAAALGAVQWWQYSAQWLRQDYTREAFLRVSTGEDWNVAWQLGVPTLMNSDVSVVAFALAMYLVYGIGTAVTFSYFAFLFNFFSELSNLATSAGIRSSKALKMDAADRDSGGLAAFETIQRGHARFCYWSLFAMYLMSMRNAYLPPDCRLPAEVASASSMIENCSSMGGFASNIYHSLQYVVRTVLEGRPDFSVLFWSYAEQQNHFIVGSLMYAGLITSFFYLISWRMTSIIEISRPNGAADLGDKLLRQIRAQNVRNLIVMMLASLSTVFLNLGPIVLVLALIFYVAGKARRA
jgi:hypothetical protein